MTQVRFHACKGRKLSPVSRPVTAHPGQPGSVRAQARRGVEVGAAGEHAGVARRQSCMAAHASVSPVSTMALYCATLSMGQSMRWIARQADIPMSKLASMNLVPERTASRTSNQL
jgi:hypothetical protein